MNGVTVPKAYRHMMRTERRPEYIEAEIRDYIKKNQGQLIRLQDLNQVAETTTARKYLDKWLKQGRITRHKLGGARGPRYTYRWHEIITKPITVPVMDRTGISVRSLDLPELLLDQKTIDNITKAFHIWLENEQDGQCIVNVVKFRKYLQEEHDKTVKTRKEILNADHDNGGDHPSAGI